MNQTSVQITPFLIQYLANNNNNGNTIESTNQEDF